MADDNENFERPASWAAVLAGMLLFLVSGLRLILNEIPHQWPASTWIQDLQGVLFLGFFLISAMGFGLGWVKGFPRWSYPYVGSVLLFSQYMTHVATPGLRIFNYTS